MTRTVWTLEVPFLAFESKSESSGAMRDKRPPFGMPPPKHIPEASKMTKLTRLPQAALCRSPRPVGFGDFCRRTMNLTFLLKGERLSFLPRWAGASDEPKSVA